VGGFRKELPAAFQASGLANDRLTALLNMAALLSLTALLNLAREDSALAMQVDELPGLIERQRRDSPRARRECNAAMGAQPSRGFPHTTPRCLIIRDVQ